MRRHPAFDLFEEICVELGGQTESVLVDDDFSEATLKDLRRFYQEATAVPSIKKAIAYLISHFKARGSMLPFTYNVETGRASVINSEYIDFVAESRNQRSLTRESRDFEVATSKHMAGRLTGILQRVGSPRTKHRTRKEFAAYLAKEYSFEQGVLLGHDKDGGLDILWFPPLGAFPFRAMVSIQCKNCPYDKEEGFKSVGRAKQTLSRHSHARAQETHLHCVLYNDYIDEKVVEHARHSGFVPLGLSDLAPLKKTMALTHL
jgi:hypothetical protein